MPLEELNDMKNRVNTSESGKPNMAKRTAAAVSQPAGIISSRRTFSGYKRSLAIERRVMSSSGRDTRKSELGPEDSSLSPEHC